MIPQHSMLLHAYGLLRYKGNRLEQAFDLLSRVDQVDVKIEDANEIKTMLITIGKKLGLASMAAELFPNTSANMTLSGRAENALKDAMAEKDLATNILQNIPSSHICESQTDGSTDSSSILRRRKKRSKRKHQHRQKSSKKHKRAHHKKGKRSKKSPDCNPRDSGS